MNDAEILRTCCAAPTDTTAMIELTLEIAEQAARAARAEAHDLGIVMTVAVVDESGRTVLVMRGDGASFTSPETSRVKAVTAANFRRSTKELEASMVQGSAFWAAAPAVLHGEVLPSRGGVPIMRGGRCIGAIGCGGGSGDQDHDCAAAGANAVAQP
jgi:glc operon protein GlcG